MGRTLKLRLLGPPALVDGDRDVGLSPGAVLLCAYLALAPHGGRSRATAAADLFADAPAALARRRLNTALWRLRCEARERAGVEILDGGGARAVALSPRAGVTVDAVEFDRLVTPILERRASDLSDQDVAALERAVALHGGHLVEACDDDWVIAERHRLEDLYLAALDYLLQHHGASGSLAPVIKYGGLALALEPLREDVHRHLMSAYAAGGRTDLVEAQFERCRAVLLSELGADPLPETVALYSRLSRGVGDASPTVAALISELERARREVTRLSAIVDRALEHLARLR